MAPADAPSALPLPHLASTTYRIVTGPHAGRRIATIDGARVTFELKTPWRDGTSHLEMAPVDFLERLAALVPRPHPACAGPTGLRRIYGIDMRTSPNCGLGRLEPFATILERDAIARILAAIGIRPGAPPP